MPPLTHSSEHFSYNELACHHCGKNEVTPELVGALEELRAIIGKSIVVQDAYRCPIHNRQVGGVYNSEHLLGLAADISVIGMSYSDLYFAALKVSSIHGIGVDAHRNYIHVDVRQPVARWSYGLNGQPVAFVLPERGVIAV